MAYYEKYLQPYERLEQSEDPAVAMSERLVDGLERILMENADAPELAVNAQDECTVQTPLGTLHIKGSLYFHRKK